VQAEFVYQQHGCVRRTTARAPDGEWLALTFWESTSDAEDSQTASEASALWRELMGAVESYSVSRYTTLD